LEIGHGASPWNEKLNIEFSGARTLAADPDPIYADVYSVTVLLPDMHSSPRTLHSDCAALSFIEANGIAAR
jgi:hypothetical protein